MTDRAQFEAMLEALINEDQEAAKEIFHNIVVAKSREIYEELLESDFQEEGEMPAAPEAPMEEESEEDDTEEVGADDEDDSDEPADDAEGEENPFGDDEGGEEEDGEGELEDRVMDLEDALEDLKAEFEQLMAGEEGEEMPADDMGGDEFGAEEMPADDMGGDEFGAEDPSMEDESMGMDAGGQTLNVKHTFAEDDEQLIREYIEKVGTNWESYNAGEGGHVGAQAGSVTGSTNTKSIVAGKNDMGGTSKNMTQGGVEVKADIGARSTVQGNGVMKPNVVPNPDAKGNINVPGGNAGKTAFKKKEPGHGAEKKGAAEQADNKTSPLSGLKSRAK
jgi:hypothetical protein